MTCVVIACTTECGCTCRWDLDLSVYAIDPPAE